MEHSPATHPYAPLTATVGHGKAAFGHAEIAALAYELADPDNRPVW